MEKLEITVRNPFEMKYDQRSGALTLSCVEATGRQVAVRFDAEATRAMSDLIVAAMTHNGGRLGRDGAAPTQQ